jgi:hypothetical protein
MVVSFGHMHRDDLGLSPLAEAGQAHADQAGPGQIQAGQNQAGQIQVASATTPAPPAPADQDRHPAPDDYCAICASMALVATGMTSLPPVLVVPGAVVHVWFLETPARHIAPRIALSFQARAPPVV